MRNPLITRLHHRGGEESRCAVDGLDDAIKRYAELAQLCVIEINLDLFLRNTLDPHFGHMLDAFDFGFE